MSGNFIVNVESILSTTNETNILYISNPSASTSHMSGIRLTGTSLENSANITFRIYIDPIITSNGTTVIVISRNFITGSTSSMNVYSIPSTTSKGTKVSIVSVAASGSYLVDMVDWYLSHGHSFLVTAQINTSNKGLALNLSWSE